MRNEVRGNAALFGRAICSMAARAPPINSIRSLLENGAKVADWQLSHMDNFDYVPGQRLPKGHGGAARQDPGGIFSSG